MVKLFNVRSKIRAEKISDKWHYRLKAAEEKCDYVAVFKIEPAHIQTLADGN